MWMCFECCCTAVRENVGWQHAGRVANRHGLFLPDLSSKLLFKKIRLAFFFPFPERKRPLWL